MGTQKQHDSEPDKRDRIIEQAREIISQDSTLPSEEKEGILKVIQILIDAVDKSLDLEDDANRLKIIAQEIISRHSLVTVVKQQADELDASRI